MDDITIFFENLIKNHRSLEIAEIEFHRMREEDPELDASYREWCEDNGESLKLGFRHYGEDYLSEADSVWDSLSDYDE